MQTFLPYADFAASAAVLDDRRLGKQRVEAFQILRALTFPAYAWKNHPAVRMWRGFTPALVAYGLATCTAWRNRGFADTVANSLLTFTGGARPDPAQLRVSGRLPPWLGLEALHLSHRSALLRKSPEHYQRFFPDIPDDLPYLWPPAVFPRWPVRRPAGQGLRLEEALSALGLGAARPGQAEAVAALRDGHDVLIALPAGSGSSTTGLLAGLTSSAPTLWVAGGSQAMSDDGGPPQPAPILPQQPRQRQRAAGGASRARPPTDVDLTAVAEEAAAAPDYLFLPPRALLDPLTAAHLAAVRPGQVVVDDAAELTSADRLIIAASVRDLDGPPVLAVSGVQDPERRNEIARTLGLANPVVVGAQLPAAR